MKSVKLSPKAGQTNTHLYDMYMHIILHFLAVISYHVILHIHDMYDIRKTCSYDMMQNLDLNDENTWNQARYSHKAIK